MLQNFVVHRLSSFPLFQDFTPSLKKPAQDQDDDYDVYLFWPSLSRRDVSSQDPSSSPLYGPVSLYSESTDFDSGWSGPPSPITFAPSAPDCRFPELDFGAAPPNKPEAGAEEPKTTEPAKYSPIFKMGLFLSQMTQLVNRAIEEVKIRMRKPESQAP
ncbi:hypothetical protein DFH94DRAFT_405642 [Russula ochroleuca]|uniref:Uncharacterized protein n=1 Tax=Russula ochroleuca TaxID=152965 RepID=A0A9P5MYF5_9AGAM|nr:hypothetical protein DFH94DRAFT_405642 [Russula ochroleuca]